MAPARRNRRRRSSKKKNKPTTNITLTTSTSQRSPETLYPSSDDSNCVPVQKRLKGIRRTPVQQIIRILQRLNRELLGRIQSNELVTYEELQLENDRIREVIRFGKVLKVNDPYEKFYNELEKGSMYLDILLKRRLKHDAEQKPPRRTVPRLRQKQDRKSSFTQWLETRAGESGTERESPNESGNYESSNTSRESSPEKVCRPTPKDKINNKMLPSHVHCVCGDKKTAIFFQLAPEEDEENEVFSDVPSVPEDEETRGAPGIIQTATYSRRNSDGNPTIPCTLWNGNNLCRYQLYPIPEEEEDTSEDSLSDSV